MRPTCASVNAWANQVIDEKGDLVGDIVQQDNVDDAIVRIKSGGAVIVEI